jgi:hypothetical protein
MSLAFQDEAVVAQHDSHGRVAPATVAGDGGHHVDQAPFHPADGAGNGGEVRQGVPVSGGSQQSRRGRRCHFEGGK